MYKKIFEKRSSRKWNDNQEGDTLYDLWRSEIRSPNVRFSSVTRFTFDVVYPPATVKPTIRFVPLLSIMHRRNRSFRYTALCFNEFKLHGAAIHSYSTSRGPKATVENFALGSRHTFWENIYRFQCINVWLRLD